MCQAVFVSVLSYCTLVVLQFHAGYISLHPSVPRVYPRAGTARSNIITAPGNSMVMMMMMMMTIETMMVTIIPDICHFFYTSKIFGE